MIRTLFFGEATAAACNFGRRSCVKRKGATTLTPIWTLIPCLVLEPTFTTPIPALFHMGGTEETNKSGVTGPYEAHVERLKVTDRVH